MMKPWRRLALAAALYVTAGVGSASAQTVIVRNAPPGSTVELLLNAATIGTATVASGGDAKLPVNLAEHVKKTETDANIFVDMCGTTRRVVLVERAVPIPAVAAGCERREIPGLFVVRKVTTLVIELAGDKPVVWLSQGPAPAEWLSDARPESSSARTWRPSPTGLVVFGGGGLASFSDPVSQACGTLSTCSGKNSRGDYAAGAGVWLTRFLGAEASYVKAAKVTADGSGSNYAFNSFLDARLLTVVGKVAAPIGPVRIFGLAGMNYHRATFSTTETINDVTVTVDGVNQTLKGGTQTFEVNTGGWGWLFGGGLEVWATSKLALYGEVGRARLKGANRGVGEGAIDDRITLLTAGARIHIGR